MTINSTKPYLVRSIYDWCIDSGFTPYISVQAFPELNVPKEYIKENEIVFNISINAVNELIINNNIVGFAARFNGVERKLEIPMNAINSIFAKEVNQGITFSDERKESQEAMNTLRNGNLNQNPQILQEKKIRKPKLRVIK
ncbi:ClpXP protease specificity-enhancing factor [Nitrosomonas ureae]|uniref:Stringent starvation protein B n=1 Tax=Nitrosomonas ureae TaxID=44577 RepID=A0A1H9E9H8_9PROT|nr:ClpXP protease specificity-enhancing factor [Nitrosomonas ureae]SEQ22434.1 stringent starvation protein B [Nitrosomonas ureae]